MQYTMNASINIKRVIGISSFAVLGVPLSFAQSTPPPSSNLGLSRLEQPTTPGAPAAVDTTKFEVDSLDIVSSPGVLKSKKRNLDVLDLSDGSSFTRPLRAKKREQGYISFAVFGSVGTIVDVGGAQIGISESAIVEGYAHVLVKSGESDWVDTHLNVPFDSYEGKRLATLPVLTVRLDPASEEFDLYANSRMLVEGAELISRSNDRKFLVSAGSEGAWLMGLVQSDINPLYIDDNGNGVDDDFELASNGELQSRGASKQQRKDLIKSWRQTERFAPPPALFVSRPRPDGK